MIGIRNIAPISPRKYKQLFGFHDIHNLLSKKEILQNRCSGYFVHIKSILFTVSQSKVFFVIIEHFILVRVIVV